MNENSAPTRSGNVPETCSTRADAAQTGARKHAPKQRAVAFNFWPHYVGGLRAVTRANTAVRRWARWTLGDEDRVAIDVAAALLTNPAGTLPSGEQW